MKTLALLLLSALSLTACATDESYSTGGGLRPANKPFSDDTSPADDDLADIEDTLNPGDDSVAIPEGHLDDLLGDNLVAVEDVIIDGRLYHRLYFRDGHVSISEDLKTPAN